MHLCLKYSCASKSVRFRRKVLVFFLLSLLIVLLGACGGSSSKILFALGLGSPQVIAFHVSSSGGLSSPFVAATTGASPIAMAIDPLGRFAYVADSTGGVRAGAVSEYVLKASSGALIPAALTSTNGIAQPVLPANAGVNPVALVVDATGKFVFVANKGSDEISVYTIDPSTGVLTPLGCVEGQSCTTQQFFPTPAGAAPNALATTGTTLLVTYSGTNQVAVYTFDSNGTLTAGSTVSTTASPTAAQLDSSANVLFVAESVSDTAPGLVESFTVGSSGQLSPTGNSAATGTKPVSLRLHPSRKFLYVANQGSGDLSAFSIGSSGALAPLTGFPIAAGSTPSAVSIDASGSLLFVANQSSNTISAFTIDSSGALKAVDGSPFPSLASLPVSLTNLN